VFLYYVSQVPTFVGEKGKMVRIHRGPSAVTGDESRIMPLF